MNNTKANSLQNDWFSKISLPVHISLNEIPEIALYRLEGSIDSNYRKQLLKKSKILDLKSMHNTKANRRQVYRS